MQTFSTLKLRGNKIGPIGKQYLEDVQQIRITPIEFDLNGKESAIELLCPQEHHLRLCNYEQRRLKNTYEYPESEYECDICSKDYWGFSWHCSCTSEGFDICETCANRQN
ncbi:unnamed protein product [Adineta steineri]|uniref:Uncharacterized protein n=1 Tax=Adineta steineri TaxID=433720 RepID=A0A813WQS4_9BILA|nr:unnamed protein product [Adineta steineri]